MSSDHDAQKDEMLALESIFDSDEFSKREDKGEFSGHFKAVVTLPEEIKVEYKFLPFVKRKRGGQSLEKHEDSQDLNHLSVKFLLPLELSFTLPPDYPSTSPPRFTLICPWLTRAQLSQLCVKLDSLWIENKGLEILYLWLSFLKEESYSFLGLGSTIDISKVYSYNLRLLEKMKKFKKTEDNMADSTCSTDMSCSGISSVAPLSSCDQMASVPSGSGSPSKGSSKGRGRGRSKSDTFRRPGPSNLMTASSSSQISTSHERNFVRDVKKVKSQLYSNGAKEITDDKDNTVKPTCVNQDEDNPTELQYSTRKSRSGDLDPRAVSCNLLQTSLISNIVDYNQTMCEKEFQRNIYSCRICFDDKPGSSCFQFPGCSHVFCRECVSSYFEVAIKDGKIHSLNCPEENCKSEALHSQIYDLVSPELFSRYDELLLSTTLDEMVDIVYCPRRNCQYPVTRDPEEKMAQCAHCSYSFCVLCRMGYHGVDPCRVKMDSGLIAEYETASNDKKLLLEKKYGRKQLQDLLEACYSEQWIKGNSKSCPHCGAAIEKSDGCNKMICWKCNTFFCWICTTRLNPSNPYKHYESPTSGCFKLLFQGMQILDDESESDADSDDDYLV